MEDWRAHSNHLEVSSVWSQGERELQIHMLKIRVAHLALVYVMKYLHKLVFFFSYDEMSDMQGMLSYSPLCITPSYFATYPQLVTIEMHLERHWMRDMVSS